MTALLSVHAVEKRFSGRTVLDGVSLEVERSEVVCLIGPSGSGKTTLLRCINHLEAVDAGRIEVNGEPVGPASDRELAAKRREIGFVFQRFNLWPHMTALQNVMEAPVRVLGVRAHRAEAEARELLRQVGLAGKGGAYPTSSREASNSVSRSRGRSR